MANNGKIGPIYIWGHSTLSSHSSNWNLYQTSSDYYKPVLRYDHIDGNFYDSHSKLLISSSGNFYYTGSVVIDRGQISGSNILGYTILSQSSNLSSASYALTSLSLTPYIRSNATHETDPLTPAGLLYNDIYDVGGVFISQSKQIDTSGSIWYNGKLLITTGSMTESALNNYTVMTQSIVNLTSSYGGLTASMALTSLSYAAFTTSITPLSTSYSLVTNSYALTSQSYSPLIKVSTVGSIISASQYTSSYISASNSYAQSFTSSNAQITASVDIKINDGFSLKIGELGSAPKIGIATLSGGAVTVSTTSVSTTSRIFLTRQDSSGNIGILSVGTIVPGTSFIINSSNALDNGVVAWWIVN